MELSQLHQLFLNSEGITTDTRALKKGAIFFALKGANFNGNEYADKAIEEGCSWAVVDESDKVNGDRVILVENVLITLQDL